MPLYSETYGYRQGSGDKRPALVFLHGLLGSGRDWRQVINILAPSYYCLTIDLPGHGQSQLLTPSDFEEVNRQVCQTLVHRKVGSYVLIGYSMGARLAMYHACFPQPASEPKLAGLVLEGGHFGLPQTECAARLANDKQWAHRFASEPIEKVLADWYRQPVFSSLNDDQRQSLIAKRSDNLGSGIAHMLQATSLAKQPFLQPPLTQLALPVHYICGDEDQKFKSLARQSGLSLSVIPDAGHNVHVEQSEVFAMTIKQFLFKNQQMELKDA